ncbi:hypothetical protein NDU88_006089 [Pleurodeles waltl]|uniref:Uncharacterized protein n=1 Tax=Pleurodeles waltl TaxID=8319 RepID=A0AAV7ULT4_PLEWA|nr:hypothetical protein NDU88_006089 [Pleurodeles waltl]
MKTFPATLHTKAGAEPHSEAGAEPRSEALGETMYIENGNPDIRIPVYVPDKGRRAGHTGENKTANARNQDIRVPERLKSKERLHAEVAEEEDGAKEHETEIAEQLDHGGNEEEKGPYLGERRPFDGREDISKGQDSPNKPKLRHVPGGTWLQQQTASSRGKEEEEEDPGQKDQWEISAWLHLKKIQATELAFHQLEDLKEEKKATASKTS